MSEGEVSGDMIAKALAPLDEHISMLEGSKAKTEAYAKELSQKVALIQESVKLLGTLKQKVEDMKKAASDGIKAIKDAETKGAADAVNAAKKAKSECEAGAAEKIQAVVTKINAQKESITTALTALDDQGFKKPMEDILGAVKALESAFGEGGSGSGNVAAKTKEIEDREKKLMEQGVAAFGGMTGGRRTRRRGGFRYGVPKSALPRTLRSILSKTTKSTRRKSPKRRKGRKGKKSRRRTRKTTKRKRKKGRRRKIKETKRRTGKN